MNYADMRKLQEPGLILDWQCGKLTVQAVVPASGRVSIKEELVDGKTYAEAMKDSEP